MAKSLRSSRSKKTTRRSRKVGGGECNIVESLMRVLPGDHDYERMVNEECRSIDNSESYEDFMAFQKKTVESLSAEDCLRVKGLLELIKAGRMSNMDMESCASMESTMLLFDKEKKLVIVNDR